MKQISWLLGILILLLLFLLVFVLNGGNVKFPTSDLLLGTYVNNEGNNDVDIREVVEAIEGMDAPPGTESAGELANALPPFVIRDNLGNVLELQEALSTVDQSAIFDQRFVAVQKSAASAFYCIALSDLRKVEGIPLIDQVRSGAISIIPRTEYCVMGIAEADIKAGVLQKDLALNPDWFSVRDHVEIDLEERVKTTTQSVNITITVQMGLDHPNLQPGNLELAVYTEPGNLMRIWLAANSKIAELWSEERRADLDLSESMTRADNLALSQTIISVVAPFDAYGQRDMSTLNQIEGLVIKAFSESSGNLGNPSPYDNLFHDFDLYARAYGFEEGLGELTVLVTHSEIGEWTWLDSMASGRNTPVIGVDDYKPFKHNLGPLFLEKLNYLPVSRTTVDR